MFLTSLHLSKVITQIVFTVVLLVQLKWFLPLQILLIYKTQAFPVLKHRQSPPTFHFYGRENAIRVNITLYVALILQALYTECTATTH